MIRLKPINLLPIYSTRLLLVAIHNLSINITEH